MYIRIEHTEDGYGFCRTDSFDNLRRDNLSISIFYKKYYENFPTPINDNNLKIHYDEYCAFRSKKIFRNFCKKNHLKFFISKGFKVYQITPKNSKKIKRGNYQILFRKEHVIYKDITEQYV